ncbi:hypothetical protein L6R52_19075 [Myxococcota bacterium]|nr:hypothetical protein [Myxococcota bacterium]
MVAVKKASEGEVVKLREGQGWRAGKPVEDPEKLKRWGFVTAKPSEFLVHVRRGRVVSKSSGQGATCFKWPWDAVAIVPTSLQRLQFQADQVTAEKVGIEVVGLAVYRIAEPLLAYRVLNFSFPERAQEKLEETLTAMFVGATRRLVANLGVEDCLQKRKSALAEELLREIAPVVGGLGRPDDATEQGWGVVIDTIEIQEVRILSEKVFASMQAPYRAALDRRAREAKALADLDIAQRDAECSREIAEAKIRSEAAVREQKRDAERKAAELDAKDRLRKLELATSQEASEIQAKRAIEKANLESLAASRAASAELERDDAEARAKLTVRQTELSALEAKAKLETIELERVAAQKRAELAREEALAKAELRRLEVELVTAEGRAKAEIELALAEAFVRKAEAEARVLAAEKLPELAEAMGRKIGEVRITQWGNDGNPFGALTQGVAAVLDLVKKV